MVRYNPETKIERPIRILYMGDSGTGKTGSLVSLLEAGYEMYMLDMDGGHDVLLEHAKHKNPQLLAQLDVEECRDKYKGTAGGPILAGPARAYVNATKLMTKWSDETVPADWGLNTIFVLDSLTFLGHAAYAWSQSINPTAKHKQLWYGQAQESVRHVLELLCGKHFNTHVIVCTHIRMLNIDGSDEKAKENADKEKKGYPTSIGKQLNRDIPQYFNTVIQADTDGQGSRRKHIIRTVPSTVIDLKNPAPFKLDDTYPLESGLATIFSKLKGDS